MLMIVKNDRKVTIEVKGNEDDVLTELFILVERIDRAIGYDVYASLRNPLKILATKIYVDRLDTDEQTKEPERKADGAESKE